MPIKPFHFLMLVPAVIGKVFGTSARMQRRVNRQHNSLTVELVKRPGVDS